MELVARRASATTTTRRPSTSQSMGHLGRVLRSFVRMYVSLPETPYMLHRLRLPAFFGRLRAWSRSLEAMALRSSRNSREWNGDVSVREPAGAAGGRWGKGLLKAKMAGAQWAKPVLVAQMEFVAWTADHYLRQSWFVVCGTTTRLEGSGGIEHRSLCRAALD